MGYVVVDFADQLAHTSKRAAPDRVLGDEPEPALNLVEPARAGRGVMEVEARAGCQPGFNPRMFVDGVVVRDQVDLSPVGTLRSR